MGSVAHPGLRGMWVSGPRGAGFVGTFEFAAPSPSTYCICCTFSGHLLCFRGPEGSRTERWFSALRKSWVLGRPTHTHSCHSKPAVWGVGRSRRGQEGRVSEGVAAVPAGGEPEHGGAGSPRRNGAEKEKCPEAPRVQPPRGGG